MTYPTVSIGIPSHNRCEMVCRAVESVLAQTYAGVVEVVVVDDGSTDDTVTALARFGDRIAVVVNDENRGIAYAKNRALVVASGELRGVLDSDDTYHPEFVASCVAELQAHPDVVAVYTDNLRRLPSGETVTEPAGDWSLDTLLGCQLRGDCFLARWSALERTQLHDELFELEVDYDLYYGLAALGPLRRIPEPLMTVTEHAGRTTTDRTKAAFWHAAGLGKYGHPVSWAERRAVAHPEWADSIRQGYAYGQSLAYRRDLRRLLRVDDNTQARWRSMWDAGGRLDAGLLAEVLVWVPERCRFVDLGCGDGAMATAICAARPECTGLGLDFAPPSDVETDRLRFVEWDLRSTDLPVTNADVVLCAEVIEHLQDPAAVFRLAKAMLNPRGYLLMSTPLCDDIKDTCHLWAFRPTDIVAMAQMHGGRVLHMAKAGDFGRRAVLYVVGFA